MSAIKELREKSIENLEKDLLAERETLFKLNMQKGSGQLSRPDQIRKARRAIARIKTLQNEKSDNSPKVRSKKLKGGK